MSFGEKLVYRMKARGVPVPTRGSLVDRRPAGVKTEQIVFCNWLLKRVFKLNRSFINKQTEGIIMDEEEYEDMSTEEREYLELTKEHQDDEMFLMTDESEDYGNDDDDD